MTSSSSCGAVRPARSRDPAGRGQNRKDVVIDGLKLTMTGLELKAKLDERINAHARKAADYTKLLKEPDPTDEAPLPESVIEGGIEQAHSQIETLTLIRDYIIADEVYRLGEFDLRFADLLPEPDWMDCGCFDRARLKPSDPGLFDNDDQPPLRN
jgi:hypothetical protein